MSLIFSSSQPAGSVQLLQLCWGRRSSHRSPHRSLRSFCSCFAPVSLELPFHLYSVIVIIIMFVYVSTLFVVVNLDAPMAVRKTLFEGFSSVPSRRLPTLFLGVTRTLRLKGKQLVEGEMFEFPAALNVVWAQVRLSGPLESEKRFPANRASVLKSYRVVRLPAPCLCAAVLRCWR